MSIQRLASYQFGPQRFPPASRRAAPNVDGAMGLEQGQQPRSLKKSGTGPSYSQPCDQVQMRSNGRALGAIRLQGGREAWRGADRPEDRTGTRDVKTCKVSSGGRCQHTKRVLVWPLVTSLIALQGPRPPARYSYAPNLDPDPTLQSLRCSRAKLGRPRIMGKAAPRHLWGLLLRHHTHEPGAALGKEHRGGVSSGHREEKEL